MGDQLTISGQGFQPEEKIFLEISPVGAPGAYRIGNISADSVGGFTVRAELGVVYPGPDVPDPAPPGQGQRVNLAPGAYQILAYPESLGERTLETIAQAPKTMLEVTAPALPGGGGNPQARDTGLPLGVLAGLLLMASGLFIYRKA
jgi:hypothetical protein